jgi:lysozyme
MQKMRPNATITFGLFCLSCILCGLVAWNVYRGSDFQFHPEPGLERYAVIAVAAHYRRLPSRPDYIPHARAMARYAEEAGYALVGGGVMIDPTGHELRQAIDVLGRLTEDGAEALVYFAGHAVPGDDTIFLLGADAAPLPMARFAEGGIRVKDIWSHPLGSGPSRITILIETRGMGGLFSGGMTSYGTGLDTLEPPEGVTLAISDRDGPVTVDTRALRLTRPDRRSLIPDMLSAGAGHSIVFTPTLIELDALNSLDLIDSLADVCLTVHERSSSQINPIVLGRSAIAAAQPAHPALLEPLGLDGPVSDEAGIDQAAEPDPDVLPEDAVTQDTIAAPGPPIPAPGPSRAGQSVIELIQMFEAFRAETYLDQAGILTIGYGHTGREARAANVISHERAVELLMEDIDIAARAVNTAVSRDLTDNQRNALISLTFNIGAEAFGNSTLVRLINSDIESVSAAEFLRWVHARVPGVGMRALRGLESHRQLEAFLFLVQDDGVDALGLILSFEPFRPSATRVNDCSMIGYGRALVPCTQTFDVQISQIEALQYLQREAGMIEGEIRALVGVPVSDGQMTALISFVHQNGLEALSRSRVLSRLNQGDHTGAANALRLHNAFVGGPAMQVGASHIERRAAEAALFFAHGGDYIVSEPSGGAS